MLTPDLDLQAFRECFAEKRRVAIPDILTAEAAESAYREISGPLPWDLSLTGERGPEAVDAEVLATLNPQQLAGLQQQVQDQALAGFSFLYGRKDLIPGETHYLENLTRTLASDEFLDVLKIVTADETLYRVDAHATVYRPGCFLKTHDDTYVGKARRLAYVLGLTKDWQADWGGLLHFVDERGDVEDVFVPGFNALTIFEVPHQHFVSYVASFAGGSRYAVTGWAFCP